VRWFFVIHSDVATIDGVLILILVDGSFICMFMIIVRDGRIWFCTIGNGIILVLVVRYGQYIVVVMMGLLFQGLDYLVINFVEIIYC
jgi:hypothetical protein